MTITPLRQQLVWHALISYLNSVNALKLLSDKMRKIICKQFLQLAYMAYSRYETFSNEMDITDY